MTLAPPLPTPVLDSADTRAMAQLAEVLRERNYAALYHAMTDGAPFAPNRNAALARLAELPGDVAALLAFLGLGLSLHEATAAPVLGSLPSNLVDAGLATRRHGEVATDGWIVVPALGGYLVTGVPPTYALLEEIGAPAYLGFESFLFAGLIPDSRGRRVLDVGAGCGIQGLLACRGASEAVLSDLDPFALRACALNAALNRVEHPVRIVAGDMYEPVAGERFDLVVALPPYVPVVEGSHVALTTGGGPDGLGMMRPLLYGAADVLAPGGQLFTFGQLLCDDAGPLIRHELAARPTGLAVELVCTDRHPLQPYVVELARRLSAHGAGTPMNDLIARYSSALRGLGATGVCTVVVRGRLASTSSVRAIGPTGSLVANDVVSPVGPLRVEPAGLEAVHAGESAVAPVDAVSLALLRALDGRRSIKEAAAAAWGTPSGAATVDLDEAAVQRAAELVAKGIVRRVAI